MGGSPRSKAKPSPSYEDGRLRDETIAECQESVTYERTDLLGLIKKAVQPRSKD